jgi:hypothetical protein
MERQKALLIVGSSKGVKSTSYALGRALLERLESRGMIAETVIVGAALHFEDKQAKMQEAVEEADLIVFSFPLYVDQLPAPLIKALEIIAERRSCHRPDKLQRITTVIQCGFPEDIHNRPAVEIIKRFAVETGFGWAGALAMGMGGAVGRKALEKAGGMVRNVIKALDLAALSLLRGDAIPEGAVELMSKPLMPRWLYILAANWGFNHELKKRGVRRQSHARPFEV